jgi:hypothetical protein
VIVAVVPVLDLQLNPDPLAIEIEGLVAEHWPDIKYLGAE